MYLSKNAYQKERPPVYLIDARHPIPVNAVAATAVITCGATNPTNAKVIVVGGITYTLKTTVVADYDIKINATEATQAGYIVAAINMTQAPGVGNNAASGLYKVPAANPFCTAVAATADVNLTAIVRGTAGNVAFPTTDDASFTVTTFAVANTGVDGTLSHKNEIRYNDTHIYRASEGNKISEAKWVTAAI